jgi:hypothetical protein
LVENRLQVTIDQGGRELADSLRIASRPYNEKRVTKKRSKAVKRRQLKERWFDAGTAAFERCVAEGRVHRHLREMGLLIRVFTGAASRSRAAPPSRQGHH